MSKRLTNNYNSPSPPSLTTNTTIRIPNDVYQKIETQAATEDKTVSFIINNILRKYVSWDQFVGEIGFVFLQKPFVRSIFEFLSEEQVVKAAKTTCYVGMKDAISFIHGKTDVDSVIDVIKLWLNASQFPNKIITKHHKEGEKEKEKDDRIEIRIQHNLGQKCSAYMKTLLSLLFADLNMKAENIKSGDQSLIVVFQSLPKRKTYAKNDNNGTINL